MYADDFFAYQLPAAVDKVIYFEKYDLPLDEDEVIKMAHEKGASSMETEGERFWVVFPDNLRRARAFTENILRRQIRDWNRNGF